MDCRKNIVVMLLLSFMMIALNLFCGLDAPYAYADDQADTQAAAGQTVDTEETEATTEPVETITEEPETTTEEPEATTEPAETTEPEETTTEPTEESEAKVEEPASVAFDESRTVDGVRIRVTAEAGVFPEGATLKVEKLKGADKKAAKAAVGEKTADVDIAREYLFDITILDRDGNEIQPEGKAKVSFETSEVADETLETKVYHVKDNGKAEALDVDVNGEIAQVETTGFSPYSLIFSHTDTSGTTKSINLRVGQTYQIGPVLDKIVISNAEQDARGGIVNAVSDAPEIVRVYEHEWAGWFCELMAADENEHYLTVTFKNESQVTVKVTSHKHHWKATGDNTDAVTIVCEDTQNCYYFNNTFFDDKGFTAQIFAEDVSYDGNPHGAEKELQQRFPTSDVPVEKDIHYVGIDGTPYADSTTAPTDAGKYKAYYLVEPQGQDDVFTVQTEYTIKKADIKFDPAPAAVSNLIYNGADQELYTPGTAKSTTVSSKTFPIKYWFAEDSSQKVEDQVLKGKDVGTFKVSYQAEGDANHNGTDVNTIEIKIGKRPVKVSGITAGNKTYDGTTKATLNFDSAAFADILEGDTLTVSAQGAFADRNAGDNKTVNITGMTLGGTDVDKYTLATSGQQETTTANITAKTLKVKWQESDELPYTGEEQAPKAEFEYAQDLSADDGKAYTGDKVQPVIRGKHSSIAVWTATVYSLSGDDAANYKLDPELSNVNKEYKIVPRKITVDWKTIEKEYAAEGLEPDWELTGFVGEYQPGTHLSITADPTELVGGKAINAGTYKAAVELTGEEAANYEITNPESPFTITKAPLKLYAQGWIYYGDKIEAKTDIHDINYDKDKCQGFKGNDGVGVLKGDVTFTTNYKFKDNATGVDDARYNLIPQNVEAANYDITETDGELTVYPKPVVLEWTREHAGKKEDVSGVQAFTYDGKEYKFTAKVSRDSYVKTPEGQQADSEITVKTYDGNVQRNSNARTDTEKYTAEAMTLSDPNYALQEVVAGKDGEKKDIETKSVDYTIGQLPIKLSWDPADFTYSGKVQEPEYTIENLQENDEGVKDEAFEIDTRTKKLSDVFDAERDPSIEAGQWKINAVGKTNTHELADENYTLEGSDTSEAEFEIRPAAVEIKWDPETNEFTYNGRTQEINYDISGLAEADREYVDIETAEGSVFSAKDAGEYNINVTALKDTREVDRKSNYTIKPEEHAWKINRRDLDLAAPTVTNFFSYPNESRQNMTWTKVSGATNYEMQYRPIGGKWITIKAGNTYFATAPKLKTKGMYEYRLRAVRAESRNEIYRASAYTNIYYRYFAGVSGVRTASGTKRFSVRWNRDPYANGYLIYYSENKNMSGAKAIQISKNTVTTRMVTKLAKGKRYYVQVRPYKVKNGKVYLGSPSVPPNVVRIF